MKLQATRFLLLATAELPLALRKMGAATTKCRNLRLLSRLKLWKNCRTENFLDVFGFVLFRRQRKTAGEGGRGCKVQVRRKDRVQPLRSDPLSRTVKSVPEHYFRVGASHVSAKFPHTNVSRPQQTAHRRRQAKQRERNSVAR